MVMSWHWFGPVGGPPRPPARPPPGAAAPAGAAPPAGGVAAAGGGATVGFAEVPVAAAAAPGVVGAAPPPRGGSTRRGAGARPPKMRAYSPTAAFSGFLSGTFTTSTRNRAESASVPLSMQPGSSSAERTPAEPEMYTYTFSL